MNDERYRDDALIGIVDELGEEILGVRWLHVRPFVVRWMDANPERCFWIVRRLRCLLRQGLL